MWEVTAVLRLRFMILAAFCILCCSTNSAAGGSKIQYFGQNVLIEGESLTIMCQATMFEPINWQKDGKNLFNGSSGYLWNIVNENNTIKSWLNVTHVQMRHTGSYQCTPIYQECHHVYVVRASSITSEYDVKDQHLKIIHPGQTLTLKCAIEDSEDSKDSKFTFKWKKDDKDVDSSAPGVEINSDQRKTELVISKAKDANAGTYECVANHSTTPAALNALIYVVSKPIVSMESDHIVVEGEKLTLECHTTGVPAPTVVWMMENTTFTNNTDRVKFMAKGDVPNAILQIDDVKISDGGEYKCLVSNSATRGSTIPASTRVRVKDKLAALWPFLGICAEVFVLCAIIFIYEKKRNKAELEESDTDNSPEQKNTPDHGKDSVRQRK